MAETAATGRLRDFLANTQDGGNLFTPAEFQRFRNDLTNILDGLDAERARIRQTGAEHVDQLRTALTDTLDDMIGNYGEDLVDAVIDTVLGIVDEQAMDRMAQHYLDASFIRAMDFRGGANMELQPARDLVANFVACARTMLGEAGNYSETRVDMPPEQVEMEVKLAGEMERYVFVAQRAGKLTPHEARLRAEQQRDAALALFAPWTAHLQPADQQEMLVEVADADLDDRAGIMAAWQRTAEQLADPDRRAVLLGSPKSEDFVEVGRPGGDDA